MINLVLGLLGFVVTGILIINGLHKGFTLANMLQFWGGLMISIGFLLQGIYEPAPWYSLIMFQLGGALYIAPICLNQFENMTFMSVAFGLFVSAIVAVLIFDSIKKIMLHYTQITND